MTIFSRDFAGTRRPSSATVAPAAIFVLLAAVFVLGGYALQKAFDSQRLLRERPNALRDLQPWLAGRELKVPSGPGLRLEKVSGGELLLVSAQPDGHAQTLDFCFRSQPHTEGGHQIYAMFLRAGIEPSSSSGRRPAARGRPVVLRPDLAVGLPALWVSGRLPEQGKQADVLLNVGEPEQAPSGTWQVALADGRASTERSVKTYSFGNEAWLLWSPQANAVPDKSPSVALFSQVSSHRWAVRLRRVAVAGCRWGGIEWQLFDGSQGPVNATNEAMLFAKPPSVGSWSAPIRSRLLAGKAYTVPAIRPEPVEDRQLFEQAQALGFIRPAPDGRVWMAPADVTRHPVLSALYRSDNGRYVFNQIKALNQDRHWVALRLKPWATGQTLPVEADPAHWHMAAAGELLPWSLGLPAVAARLQNTPPLGYGDWVRVLAPAPWLNPALQDDSPAESSRVKISLPVVANVGTSPSRLYALVLGRLHEVQGATVVENQAYCQGAGCDADQLLRRIGFELEPGAKEVRLVISSEDGFNRLNPSVTEQRRVQWHRDHVAWVDAPDTPPRSNPADVTLLTQDGQSLFALGRPTELALATGLVQQIGLAPGHVRSLAGNLARLGAHGHARVAATTTIETEYQRSLQSVLRCKGHQEGRWLVSEKKCSDERVDVPLQRISAAVLIDASTGAILASAAGRSLPAGVSTTELLDLDGFNPAHSPLKMPVQHHTGGLTQTPGSTFKVLDALMLEKLATQSASIDGLLEGQASAEWEKRAQAAGLEFQMNSACYPAPCGGQLNQVENHMGAPTSRYLEANRFGLVQALRHSTNTWFAMWAEMTDKTAGTGLVEARGLGQGALSSERPLPALMEALGFTQPLSLDGGLLPAEMRLAPGDALLATASVFDPMIDTHNIRLQALGLRMQTTPVHMARVAAGVATGSLPQVHLLSEINGQPARLQPGQPLEMRLDRVRKGMNEVVRAGTAARAFSAPSLKDIRHLVHAKTGTAQQGEGQCSGLDRQAAWPPNCLNNAWFVGYLLPGAVPGEQRTLAFAVQVTHSRQTGGAAAAAVVSTWLQDRRVPPNGVENAFGPHPDIAVQ